MSEKETQRLCIKCFNDIVRRPAKHIKEQIRNRRCSECGNDTVITYTKRGYPHRRWYHDSNGKLLCQNCQKRLVYRPIHGKNDNDRRVRILGRNYFLKQNIRKDVCSKCGKVDKFTRIASIDNKLIELCPSCYMKQQHLNRWENHQFRLDRFFKIRQLHYNRKEWINLKRSIVERDNFMCQECKADLHALPYRQIHIHHIKSWKNYPLLRFESTNLITLCASCHRTKYNSHIQNNDII